MKNFTFLVVLFVLLVAGKVAQAATITIMVGDNFYSPQTVTAQVGDVITWQYKTGSFNTHPTESDTGAWTTFTMNSANPSHSITFTAAGSYPYHCDFHGGPGTGMYGVLTVTVALPTVPAQALVSPFSVYPNPASRAVTLRVAPSQSSDHNTVQLVDMLGRLVQTKEINQAEIGQELTLDVADLPTGIYVYRLLMNNQVVAHQRLILQN